MSADDPGCFVRWCDERQNHTTPHRRALYDVNGIDVDTARPAIFQVNVEGLSARVKAVVIVSESKQVGLTWHQVGELASVLAAAERKYAATT